MKLIQIISNAFITALIMGSQMFTQIRASGKNSEKEREIAKSIVLYQLVEPTDSIFERQMKSLVSNFLVNTAVSLHKNQVSENDDYDELTSTTERAPELWPSYFGDRQTYTHSENNKTTTTPPPSYKLFTWPAFFFTTPSTTPLTSTIAETTSKLNNSEIQQDILPGRSQELHEYVGSNQINTAPLQSELESYINPSHNSTELYKNAPYQNNFGNLPSYQLNNFEDGASPNNQNEGQFHFQQNLQTANQFNQNQSPVNQFNQHQLPINGINQFATGNQFQTINPTLIQNINENDGFNSWTQGNSYINSNENAGQTSYLPNQNSFNMPSQLSNGVGSPLGTQTLPDNVLVWPESFMPPQIPYYETTTAALLPNVPGQPINFFTTPSTKPPKRVFTWPSFFLKSTEPVPTLPWSLPEDPHYATPSPDEIYSPPKKISSWSQFPSNPLTTPKPFRHTVSTFGTTTSSTKRSLSPFKIFTWPSFYFTSTVKSIPTQVVNLNQTSNSPMIINSSITPFKIAEKVNNVTIHRKEPENASPRPEPQKSAPLPEENVYMKPTSPMTENSTEKSHQVLEESTEVTSSAIMPTEQSEQTTSNSAASKPVITTQNPKPPRKPAGLIGAIQHFALIVPDALRPGRNTTSILNKQSVNSILKIIGSVAFLNLSGVIDNSVTLGTSDPVRELVSGVTGLVLCNPVVKQLSGGRCARELQAGQTLEHMLKY